MSNSEERLLILKMLEEGKITSEEAARLLEALEGSAGSAQEGGGARRQRHPNFYDEIEKARQRLNEWKRDFNKKYSQKDFDRLVEEFCDKAERIGRNVASATLGIVDKMIDFVGSFVDTSAFNIFGSYAAEERSFEVQAAEGTDLTVEGLNGHILVKRHLDDKIMIRSKVRSPQNNADEILAFSEAGGAVSLKLNKTGNLSVSHEVFLPAIKLGTVKFETSNGKIYVEDCLSDVFECITKNSPVDLMGVTSDKIAVSTKNARIQIGYVIGRNIDINTNNSVIDMKNVKAETVKAVTTNGRIFIENVQNYGNLSETNLLLKTSYGGIKINMNDMDNRGYKVKAQTAGGSINLLIPELIYYNINKQGAGRSFVEAESNGYVNYPVKVNIYAETVNGDIEVVK